MVTSDHVKASEGAEKSCHPRRRRRGQRKAKLRSRACKAPRTADYSTLDANPMASRRKLKRIVRETLWGEKAAKVVVESYRRLEREAEVSKRGNWFIATDRSAAFRRGTRGKIDQLSRLAHRHLGVTQLISHIDRGSQIPLDSFEEVGFGWPTQSPRERILLRLTRPTIDDLFPDSGPITLAEWKRKSELRLRRRTKSVVPCRCRGYHVWCDDCGGCIYGGSNCHKPRSLPKGR